MNRLQALLEPFYLVLVRRVAFDGIRGRAPVQNDFDQSAPTFTGLLRVRHDQGTFEVYIKGPLGHFVRDADRDRAAYSMICVALCSGEAISVAQ